MGPFLPPARIACGAAPTSAALPEQTRGRNRLAGASSAPRCPRTTCMHPCCHPCCAWCCAYGGTRGHLCCTRPCQSCLGARPHCHHPLKLTLRTTWRSTPAPEPCHTRTRMHLPPACICAPARCGRCCDTLRQCSRLAASPSRPRRHGRSVLRAPPLAHACAHM